MTQEQQLLDAPFPPEPGALIGMNVRQDLWGKVLFAVFDDDETLTQSVGSPDGSRMCKLRLKPLSVDAGDADDHFKALMRVEDVLWEGIVQ